MRQILTCIIAMLCIGSAAFSASPAVTATVTITDSSMTYNYRLTNSTNVNIWGFGIFMPAGAAGTIISNTTSQAGWSTMIRKAGFDMIYWGYPTAKPSDPKIAPGSSADFSFTTAIGVPTTYSFTPPGHGDDNWTWWEGGSGGVGNTILPVPAPIPEPSSLVVLTGGLVSLLAFRRRIGK